MRFLIAALLFAFSFAINLATDVDMTVEDFDDLDEMSQAQVLTLALNDPEFVEFAMQLGDNVDDLDLDEEMLRGWFGNMWKKAKAWGKKHLTIKNIVAFGKKVVKGVKCAVGNNCMAKAKAAWKKKSLAGAKNVFNCAKKCYNAANK